MKIAFTAAGTDLTAPLDDRFGRAAGFLLYDLETGAKRWSFYTDGPVRLAPVVWLSESR